MKDAEDHEAWHTFVEVYAPLVYRFARKRGLQDADAADLTQEVLASVADAMKRNKYEPGRGSFRGWLHTITRNAVYKHLRRGQADPSNTPNSFHQGRVDQIPAATDQEEWDHEYHKRLFAWACEEVRGDFTEKTWEAFWRTAVDGMSVKEVAKSLGVSAGAIYVAKSRILTRIKEVIAETDWSPDNDQAE